MFRLPIFIFIIVGGFILSGCGKRRTQPNLANDVEKFFIHEDGQVTRSPRPPERNNSSIINSASFVPKPALATERRAAFDIGSGSMKLRVMDVTFGKESNSYAPVVDGSHHRRVDFQASIDDTGEISEKVVKDGIRAVTELKAIAVAKGATVFAGVATGAFRKAFNGEEVLSALSRAAAIDFHVISSEMEATLAFQAADAFSDFEPENLVVWDIGASTMSISGMSLEGSLEVYESSLASTGLRDDVMRSIQGKINDADTPNPLEGNEAEVAVVLVQSEAEKTVPRSIKERILLDDTVVAGVGPVHSLSVNRLLKPDEPYTKETVERALYKHLNMTDAQIGGRFADTDVVNLILVLGFMRGLGIDEVKVVEVNMAHGLILDENFWR